MEKTIKVKVKEVYGNRRVYVQGDVKEPLQMLTGTVTLSVRHLDALKALGFTVEVEAEAL